MRIVCDTNVLVRAPINPNGPGAELLRRIRSSHTLVSSYPLLAELLEVLRRPKLKALHGRDEYGIRRLVTSIYKVAVIVSLPQPIPRVVPRDPDDDAVLLTAIGGKANVLATRDQHFFHPDVLSFAAAHGVRIVTDDELLVALQGNQP